MNILALQDVAKFKFLKDVPPVVALCTFPKFNEHGLMLENFRAYEFRPVYKRLRGERALMAFFGTNRRTTTFIFDSDNPAERARTVVTRYQTMFFRRDGVTWAKLPNGLTLPATDLTPCPTLRK